MPRLTKPRLQDSPSVTIREYPADPSRNASLAPIAAQVVAIQRNGVTRSEAFNALTTHIKIDSNFPFSFQIDIGQAQYDAGREIGKVMNEDTLPVVERVYSGQMLAVTTTARYRDHGFFHLETSQEDQTPPVQPEPVQGVPTVQLPPTGTR